MTPPVFLNDQGSGFSHRSVHTDPAKVFANPFIDCLDAMGYNYFCM
jgi:hypothetical protein